MSVVTNRQDVTLTCGFFNGEDRTYDAEQMSRIFDGIILDGIYESIGDRFVVTESAGSGVIVGSGKAWFNGTWTLNDDPKLVDCDPADTLSPRYDTIVIEVDKTEAVRDNFIKVIHGEPGTNPVKPALNTKTDVFQYPLAHIYRPANDDVIRQSYIENCVGTETKFVTGILEARSIDDLLKQWRADLDDFRDTEEAEMDAAMDKLEDDFEAQWETLKSQMQSAVDETEDWTKDQEAYFLSWFTEMKNQLSADAAGNLQNQLNTNEIKRLMICGLDSGTKTISEDGRVITTVDNRGFIHTKEYSPDFSTCMTWLESPEGVEIAFMIKNFSQDGSVISTELNISGGDITVTNTELVAELNEIIALQEELMAPRGEEVSE